MTSTKNAADLTEEDWENTAYSHLYVEGEFIRNTDKEQQIFVAGLGPTAGVLSTANDMAKYLKFHISDGQNDAGEEVMLPSVVRDIRGGVTYRDDDFNIATRPEFPVDDVAGAYAIGVWTGMYRGHEKIYHTGSGSAYNCRMTMLMEAAIGVWTCTNGPGGTPSEGDGVDSNYVINMFALDLLLDEDPWLNETTGCTYPDPWSPSVDTEVLLADVNTRHLTLVITPRRPLQEYEGTYVHPGCDIFTVYVNDTTGTLYYRHGQLLNGELRPKEERDEFNMMLHQPLTYVHWFSLRYRDGFPLSFGVDEDDNVVAVTVHYFQPGWPPTFQREN